MKMMPFFIIRIFINKLYMIYKLIYVNKLGFNYKGMGTYEFLFCDDTIDLDDVWGEGWEAIPAESMAQPPDIECVIKAGTLQTKDYELEVAHDSMFFGLCDAKDDVIALAWESIDENFDKNRLVFRFGESLESVETKLGKRKLNITYEN